MGRPTDLIPWLQLAWLLVVIGFVAAGSWWGSGVLTLALWAVAAAVTAGWVAVALLRRDRSR